VTLHIATNADSLGSWFLPAIAEFTAQSGYLVNLAVDDQDHTAEWLQGGRVLAAVTSLEKPIPGCRSIPLGTLRYHATASAEFHERHFTHGVTAAAIASAPMLTFNQKDNLQSQWIAQTLGQKILGPTHWLPSTQSFVDACLLGIGWGMNPQLLVREHLQTGRLVEIIPATPLDVPLFWQVNRLSSAQLSGLTDAVVRTARSRLQT
jgi:LysR family transcriptional regulator (chromosome initiation inhibitor)